MSDLPDGWEIVSFDTLYAVPSRNGLNRPKSTRGTGIKMINMGELFAHPRIGNVDMERVQLADTERENYLLESGDLLFARQSLVVEGAGKCSVIVDLNEPTTFESHIIRVRLNKQMAEPEFYFNYFQSFEGFKAIQSLVVGIAVAGIRGSDLSVLKVPLPPLPEQRKIAEILSTWDEAIQLVEALIAALKERKRGLMQRLLTGEVRFAGFDEEWEREKAGEIFETFSKRKNSGEELLSVTQDQGVIPRSMLDTRVVMPDGSTDGYKLVEPGDFIISLRSFQGGLEYSEYQGLVSPAYTVLKPQLPINDNFYRHFFKSQEFIGRLAIAVIGIRDGKQISFRDFADMRLPYIEVDEQKIIGDTLQLADAVITEYSKLATTFREQKKGLMQRLLTGEVRVDVSDDV